MPTQKCPPLEFDDALLRLIEEYGLAKKRAAEAMRRRSMIEAGGHYDSDTPLSQRAVAEGEEAIAERLAAIALADDLLSWVQRHK